MTAKYTESDYNEARKAGNYATASVIARQLATQDVSPEVASQWIKEAERMDDKAARPG